MQAAPTHVLGVVYRKTGPSVEYLLVRPKSEADEWLLPKGHIEPGETPEAAAVREAREETGVIARVINALPGVYAFRAKGEAVRALCFLMEYQRQGKADEARETGWFPLDAASAKLTFKESRAVLQEAERIRTDRSGKVGRP